MTTLSVPRPSADKASQAFVARLCGVTKRFGPTLANDAIDLDVPAGAVLGLVGGNGAGKSTLMRVLCGVLPPDEGTVEVGGQAIDLAQYGPAAAHRAGIRIVHQELSLCDNLTVAENFFLEAPEAARPLPGWRTVYRQRAHAALDEVFPGHGVDVNAAVRTLPIGQRQMVEIARAAAVPGVRLLVLDEPTSSLALERSRQLRAFIAARAAAGLAFIFISHKLQEVVDIATDVIVLRNGRVSWSGDGRATTVAQLVAAMGSPTATSLRGARARAASEHAEAVRLRGRLTAPLGREIVLRRGEVVGLAGLEGSGQKELLHALFVGARGGEIVRQGRASFVSGDRQREGIFPQWDVLANIGLGRLADRAGLALVSDRAEREAARGPALRLKLDTARFASPILELSGGNQQKALVARALVGGADTVLLDDPTRGVDVGAKADFYQTVGEIAASGRLVVWHSTEDIEFLECDRVLVFSGGRIVGELVGAEITEQAIVDAAFAEPGTLRAREAKGGGVAASVVRAAPFLGLAIVLGTMMLVNPLAASPFGLDLLLGPGVPLVLVALAQMFVVGGSEIDLGVGAFAGLVSVVAANLLVDRPALGAVCLVAALLASGLVGAIIQARRIPAIVVTLGASFIWTGIGYSLQPAPGGSSPEWLAAAFGWQLPGVPTSLVLILLAMLPAWLVDRAPLGVVLRGFGNNPAAMARSGWPALRYAVIRYLLAGCFALAAGLLLTALNTASDINAGGPFTLISVAAVVIGGCALMGGLITPLGVVAGALTLSLIGALLGILDVSTDNNAAVQGCLLLAMLVLRTVAGRGREGA
jgi:ribose transport system permease protein/ribose transport system ATP-binding protein